MICGCGMKNNKNDLSKIGLSLLFIIVYYELPWFSISTNFQLFIKMFSTIFNYYQMILSENVNKDYIDYIYLLHIIIIYIVIKLLKYNLFKYLLYI